MDGTEDNDEGNDAADSGSDEKQAPQIRADVLNVGMIRHGDRRDQKAKGKAQLLPNRTFIKG